MNPPETKSEAKMAQDEFGRFSPADFHVLALRRSGAGAGLFCFPGSGGDVHVFDDLVAAFPEGRPVYAIDMEWLCETSGDFTIEQIAACCLNVIRDVQQEGPYYFCGYSFGGLVAYELATRLIDRGDSVNMVALLDAPNPALLSSLSRSDSLQFRKTYLLDRFKGYMVQLARGDIKAFVRRGFAFVVSRAGSFFVPGIKAGFRLVNRPLPKRVRANDPGFLKAWRFYIPKRYSGSLVCFRAEKRGPEYDRDPSMGWRTCAMGKVEVHIVPGQHVDMMREPSVRAIAEKMAVYLDSGSTAIPKAGL